MYPDSIQFKGKYKQLWLRFCVSKLGFWNKKIKIIQKQIYKIGALGNFVLGRVLGQKNLIQIRSLGVYFSIFE